MSERRLPEEGADPVWDVRLDPAEFARREAEMVRALDGPEGEAMRELHEWFCRRYPTPLARLRYVRRQFASIAATQTKMSASRPAK